MFIAIASSSPHFSSLTEQSRQAPSPSPVLLYSVGICAWMNISPEVSKPSCKPKEWDATSVTTEASWFGLNPADGVSAR